MNKKEVLEIRKQFSPANCTITRICSCYVDAEKVKKLESTSNFLSLPEAQAFKYFEIFKKTLSGSISKNLLEMGFLPNQKGLGGTQGFLRNLRDSKLQDAALVTRFFDRVIEEYNYTENYYIVLIHSVYDIPGKTTDNIQLDDSSDSVYEHILCSICPVKLSKPGLSYNADNNGIEERTRDWVVDRPAHGFLFPAFSDRSPDEDSFMYYSQKTDDIKPAFINYALGGNQRLSALEQREIFNQLLSALGAECTYDVMCNIHEKLLDKVEEHKENPEPLVLSREDIRSLFDDTEISQNKIEELISEIFEYTVIDDQLLADNITSTKEFLIQTPDVVIKVNPERTDLLETKVIEGRKCIVIEVGDYVEVNGVNAKAVIQS